MPVKLSLGAGAQTVALELKDGVYKLGREKPADVVIPDSTISANHAELQVQASEWTIRDLGSTNGTFLNDVPVRSAVRVRPSDELRLGSVHVRLTSPDAPLQQALPGAVGPRASTVRIEKAKAAAGKLQWNVRYWIAGAEAIVFLLILFFFIQLYSASNVAKQFGVIRYRMLASQYVHVLRNPSAAIPAPIIDESLAEPYIVADADGKILYPSTPEDQPKQSPVINPKTKKVFQNAKYGLFSIPGSEGDTEEALQSYPVRSGGDVLGFVIARPAEVSRPAIGFILVLLLLSSVVSLLLLLFALKPVHNIIRSALESARLKVSPLANGFVDSLPRGENFAEANALAEEVEKAIRSLRAGSGKAAAGQIGGRAGSEFIPIVAELFTASDIPYCFVDNDFKIAFMSNSFARVGEFGRAGLGTSIFETGLTSLQAKQLVQAIGDARRDGEARTQLALNRDGNTETHNVVIRMMEHPQSRAPMTGLVFAPTGD